MLTIFLKNRFSLILLLALFVLGAHSLSAQMPSTFTYQGRLIDNNVAVTGQYDLTFALYDVVSGGSPLLNTTLTREDVQVTDGVFTVELDFSPGIFEVMHAKYLEIGVRPGLSTGAFTTLTPRQPITAAPYALHSQNAEELGNVAASNYIQEGDVRLTDGRAPNAGSSNYVQNGTTQQASTNFNISGDGSAGGTLNANVVNSATQFNLGSNRFLSAPGTQNTFAGFSTGNSNIGTGNAFFGYSAGLSNSAGSNNSFFGANAGLATVSNGQSSFFGSRAGVSNTGAGNSFFGYSAGQGNSTGISNSFFGRSAGAGNATGTYNTALGESTTFSSASLNYATAIGARAAVGSSDTIVLGKVAGTYDSVARPADSVMIPGNLNVSGTVNGGNLTFDASFNTLAGSGAGSSNVGSSNTAFGNSAGGSANLSGGQNSFFGKDAGSVNTTGNANTFIGEAAGRTNTTGSSNTYLGQNARGSATLTNAAAIGANANVTTDNTMVLGTSVVTVKVPGNLNVTGTITGTLPTGSTNYIQNGTAQQAASDFNVSGDGTAGGTLKGNVVSATTQFNIGTNRVLFTDVSLNTFVGLGAGGANTAGSNSFFGRFAGNANTTGSANAFFGRDAGKANSSGGGNVFLGDHSGESSTTGDGNTFVGHNAGGTNTTGSSNTAIGDGSNIFVPTLTNATAIGADARVTTNNSLVLGSINGINNATADTKVGIGTTAPTDRLTVKTATSSYGIVHTDGAITLGTYVGGTGAGGYFGTKSDHPLHFFTHDSSPRMTIDTSGRVGIGTTAPATQLQVNGDVYVENSTKGLILRSPGLGCFRLTVDNTGALSTVLVSCPLP